MNRNQTGRFERTGSVSDLPGRGPERHVHNDAAVEDMRLNVLEDPSASTRRRSAQLDIARTSNQKILRLDLFIVYLKNSSVQNLLPQYTEQCLQNNICFKHPVTNNNNFRTIL